jgi:hypothetical protein
MISATKSPIGDDQGEECAMENKWHGRQAEEMFPGAEEYGIAQG